MIKKLKKILNRVMLHRVADALQSLQRDTIRLYTECVEEDKISIGATKIGGRPDVPNDFIWPMYLSKPLSFLAQLNFKEISEYDQENILPSAGMLYFFYDSEQETWGFDPKDIDSFKVIYYEGSLGSLDRIDLPSDIPEYARYAPCRVTLKSEKSLPPWESYEIDSLQLSEKESDAYFDMIEGLLGEDERVNKLLGYPDQVQGEMQMECQLVTNGLYCGDESGYEDPRREELEEGAKDWRLLFQLDSDDNAGMMWGDVGRIYFWIKNEDLIAKRFEKVWMILQCF